MVDVREGFLYPEMATVVGQRGDATLTCGSSGVGARVYAEGMGLYSCATVPL